MVHMIDYNKMRATTLNRLKDLASGLPPLYTYTGPNYGVYYRDDSDAEETLLSGAADPVTRDAICFLIEALKAVQEHPYRIYREDDRDAP